MFTPRAATKAAVAAASLFLAMPVLALTEHSTPTVPTASQAPLQQAARPAAQQSASTRPQAPGNPEEDFVGLDYSDEQKAAIEKIHRQTVTRREAILRDTKLSQEQRDAMLFGYKRMEYTDIYKVLTPEQQSKVRDKIKARHAAEKEAHKGSQAPRGPFPTH